MDVHSINRHVFYEFAEEFIGFSVKGSGRIVSITNQGEEIILTIKKYSTTSFQTFEFIFSNEYCVYKTNYWNSKNITDQWEEYYSRTQEYGL